MTPTTDDAAEVQRELTVFARRVRANGGRWHPELPFVAHSLLSEIAATGGCRAVDLVHLYQLDKSTVSRQVADLEERGLVVRVGGGRGRLLQASEAGSALLAEAARAQREELERRVADWEPGRLAEFAGLLRRFNAG
jgi:DNA-binding MarR family transcriptional regulator